MASNGDINQISCPNCEENFHLKDLDNHKLITNPRVKTLLKELESYGHQQPLSNEEKIRQRNQLRTMMIAHGMPAIWFTLNHIESLHTHFYQVHIQHLAVHDRGEADRGCPFCGERYARHDKLKEHIFNEHRLPAHQQLGLTPYQPPTTVLPASISLELLQACLRKTPGARILLEDIEDLRKLLNEEGWYGHGSATLQRLNRMELDLRETFREDHKVLEQLWEFRVALHTNGWDADENDDEGGDETSDEDDGE
ncbi:hypothetical protein GGR57DRAFT_498689 [Xylariaceae sp. FL1272]|nr:hypothetical protein GGR57DRAFT_498689 [Xylariaceae sp. FL1272]